MTDEPNMASEDRSPSKPLLHWEEILKVLSQPDPLADLIIEVEGHQLFTSKYLLANVSSKFREIFKTAADTDEGPSSLPLPSTPLRAAIDLLRWLLPAESLTISAENVELLLPLVVEYDIAILLKECDQYFMEKLKSSTNSEDFVEYLLLAQRYRMSLAYDLSVSHLARLPLKAMKNIEGTPDISSSTMSDILAKRVELLETDPSADKGPSIPETVTLVVDERLIEVSSAALITASDVLKTMLESDFLERNTGQIALCGKSYEAAKFMATYVSSKDHVPIPGDLLEECVGLAEEYMMGRLKSACIEYMLTKTDEVGLDVCLLYLYIATKYQIQEVEEKVLQTISHIPTADVTACTNYDLMSAAPLILRHAQWLEDGLEKYKKKIENILVELKKVLVKTNDGMKSFFNQLERTIRWSDKAVLRCEKGHSIEASCHCFRNDCHACAFLCRKTFAEKLKEYHSGAPQHRFVIDIQNLIADVAVSVISV